jgi:glycosyltransferase involved in cell wall biosynthesis
MRRPDAVVVLRDPDSLVAARQVFPQARLYLWLHDFGSAEFVRAILEHCRDTNAEPIAVSHWYAAHISEDEESNKRLRPRVIYNPIDDTLPSAAAAFDKNKLVFFSSPKKGLAQTLPLFEQARASINPAFKLFLMNPGYYKSTLAAYPNVVDLGVLPHAKAIEHVRGALCVFYPNSAIPETFGLVFAEANAVGTPVLTMDIGAAREILYDPAEVCSSVDEVLPRLESWYKGARPTVKHKPEFLTSNVVRSWLALLR